MVIPSNENPFSTGSVRWTMISAPVPASPWPCRISSPTEAFIPGFAAGTMKMASAATATSWMDQSDHFCEADYVKNLLGILNYEYELLKHNSPVTTTSSNKEAQRVRPIQRLRKAFNFRAIAA
jgi:hypothetical protein